MREASVCQHDNLIRGERAVTTRVCSEEERVRNSLETRTRSRKLIEVMTRNGKFMELSVKVRGEAPLGIIGIHWATPLPELKGES